MNCSICGNTINDKYGNNAQPINDGRCCDDCNTLVIIERIKEMSNDTKLKYGWTNSWSDYHDYLQVYDDMNEGDVK